MASSKTVNVGKGAGTGVHGVKSIPAPKSGKAAAPMPPVQGRKTMVGAQAASSLQRGR